MGTNAADYLAETTRELTALAERNGLWVSAALLQMAYLDLCKAAHRGAAGPNPAGRRAGATSSADSRHLQLVK